MSSNGYANPEVLVDTDWAAENLDTENVRFVEVDVNTAAYDKGHLPGAVGWNWQIDTQDAVTRDIPDEESFAALASRSGIDNQTTVVLYGDNNNWFATYAFWLLKYYGHEKVLLINGGRKKWEAEGRQLVTDVPEYAPTTYQVTTIDKDIRALRGFVEASLDEADRTLIDVRSAAEYSGELIAPEGIPQEGSQRAGHIPGAANVPWSSTVAEDGSFKPAQALWDLYEPLGISPEKEVIAYCRIGERSSHTWFVLRYLLGISKVRNYDGSWTEWGSLIGVPIEKG